MSISSGEIKFYGSSVMPEDDTTASVGGEIDTSQKIEFTDISPSGTVEMFSSASGDIGQTVIIYGRNAAGEAINESKLLNGTNIVQFTSTFERILKVVMSSSAIGTVTIRKTGIGSSLITLEAGIRQVRRPFYNAMSPSVGTRRYYEKIFCKNTMIL